MLVTIEKILDSNLAAHAFTESDLEHLFDGTPASRYAIVNKALKKNELVRLRRGLYVLCEKYLPVKLSKLYLANRIVQHSYISLESALAYHGWIPERVTSVECISSTKRKLSFTTPLGEFNYYPISINDYEFLTGVVRETADNFPFLISTPLRALLDLVYVRKIDWQGWDFLTENLRIEEDELFSVNENTLNEMKNIYTSKRVLMFIKKFQQELTKRRYKR